MRFLAIDFETANQRRSSACAVGVVVFDEHHIWHHWHTLLNPEEDFSDINTGIHGITSQMVADAPTTIQFARKMWAVFDDIVLVSHTNFDVSVIKAISRIAGIEPPKFKWIDSCALARNAWPYLDNHKLPTICKHLGVQSKHHNALEDTIACSIIARSASKQLGLSFRELARRAI